METDRITPHRTAHVVTPRTGHRAATAVPGRSRAGRRLLAGVAVIGLGFGAVACGDDDDAAVITDPPATDPADPTDPDDLADDFDESSIIGLTVDEAQAVVEADGRQFRVAEIDGESQALTADFVEGRVNVAVVDGLVESVAFIG